MVEGNVQSAKRPRIDGVPEHVVTSPLRHVKSLVERFLSTPDANKLVFVMVGLPARGKSFISMRLSRFLNWHGIETRTFNAGNHRRHTETGIQDASYFDPHSSAAQRRDTIAMEVISNMLAWLDDAPERISIFDATNTTKARRVAVAQRLAGMPDVGVIFLESICTDPEILEANLAVKLDKSPDYKMMDREEAKRDLQKRVANYEQVYEPLDETEMLLDGETVRISYIKLLNFSSFVTAQNVFGRTAITVLPYLMALHVGLRPVWLVRMPHADQTAQEYRRQGKGWPPPASVHFSEEPLSSRGEAFADLLHRFAKHQGGPSIAVITCTHTRALTVAARFGGKPRARTSLNPQDRGDCDGLSSHEIQEKCPDVWADPLHRRFPGGESLTDVVQRMTPTLIELEQEMRPVLVVAPLSTLQVLYCYFAQMPVSQAMSVTIPRHTAIELRPSGGDFVERRLGETEMAAACG